MTTTPLRELTEAILHLQEVIASICPNQPPHLLAIVLSNEDRGALHSFERILRMDPEGRHLVAYYDPLPNVIVTLESTHVMKEPRYGDDRSYSEAQNRNLLRDSDW